MGLRTGGWSLALGALLFGLLAANASATVFQVDAGSSDAADADLSDGICDATLSMATTPCTLRAAVQTADSPQSPTADEIEIPAGTYTFAGALDGDDDTSALGDLDITTNLKIRGTGGNATINAANLDRIFHIPSGLPTVELSNLTLTAGTAAAATHGGAIKAESGTLTVRNSTISGNQAVEAGAPGFSSRGGGIYAGAGAASLTLTDSTVAGNQVNPGAVIGGFGGGIYSEAPVNLERSTVSGNVTAQGCTQISCGSSGGGLYVTGGGTLTNVTVYGNLADGNAGGNSSSAGGIVNGGALLTLVNSTIANNTTSGGVGGLGGGNLVAGGEIILRNSIVANGSSNRPGNENCGLPDFGPFTSQGHNLEARAGQGATQCGLNQSGDILDDDAALGTFDFHNGTTKSVALMPLSPAVNAGGPSGPATDQRGVSRPQGPACDIGAFELEGTVLPGYTCAGPPVVPTPTPNPSPPAGSNLAAALKKCKKKKSKKARKKCIKRVRKQAGLP